MTGDDFPVMFKATWIFSGTHSLSGDSIGTYQ